MLGMQAYVGSGQPRERLQIGRSALDSSEKDCG